MSQLSHHRELLADKTAFYFRNHSFDFVNNSHGNARFVGKCPLCSLLFPENTGQSQNSVGSRIAIISRFVLGPAFCDMSSESTPPGFPPLTPSQIMGPPGFACDPERFMMVGSVGGAMIGFFSGYFDPNRMPIPHSPLPSSAPQKAHIFSRVMIQSSALGWRVFKRMFVGSILYPVVVCQLQGKRKTATVLQCGVAGSVCGAIFGLRAGPIGMVNGSVTFFVMATLVEGYRQFRGI
ncbi:uncharacterized protein LOC118436066 [Folsomia candida]|uniref:uncharacterized protein LOC118436066 n=1 Tax=Folsomia candida TaxID=158441 RepID=UPI00160518E4|nr:uncharacterized protein LOC118436066 [Folsomia candida]